MHGQASAVVIVVVILAAAAFLFGKASVGVHDAMLLALGE